MKKSSRRDFLRSSTATASGLILFGGKNAKAAQLKSSFSVLQGFTTETSTQITVDVPSTLPVLIRLVQKNTGKTIMPATRKRISHGNSEWCVAKVRFEGLLPATTYLLQIVNLDNDHVDERELQTLDTTKKNARIAMISCQFDYSGNMQYQWDQFDKANPDMAFFIGDAIYGDIAAVIGSPDILWGRFVQARQNIPFYHRKNLIPVHGVWDDHDYGLNDVGHEYEHKESSLRTYNAFFAQEAEAGRLEKGPGNSSAFDAFGQRFLFLDNRWFLRQQESQGLAYWGEQQREWMFSLIENSPYPLWLLQGAQFFGAYRKSGLSAERSHAWELDLLGRSLQRSGQSVLLASGDVHYSELSEIEKARFGFKTYEVTSSSMHSINSYTGKKNSRRIGYSQDHNFVVVDIENHRFNSTYGVKCIADNKVAFEKLLDIY